MRQDRNKEARLKLSNQTEEQKKLKIDVLNKNIEKLEKLAKLQQKLAMLEQETIKNLQQELAEIIQKHAALWHDTNLLQKYPKIRNKCLNQSFERINKAKKLHQTPEYKKILNEVATLMASTIDNKTILELYETEGMAQEDKDILHQAKKLETTPEYKARLEECSIVLATLAYNDKLHEDMLQSNKASETTQETKDILSKFSSEMKKLPEVVMQIIDKQKDKTISKEFLTKYPWLQKLQDAKDKVSKIYNLAIPEQMKLEILEGAIYYPNPDQLKFLHENFEILLEGFCNIQIPDDTPQAIEHQQTLTSINSGSTEDEQKIVEKPEESSNESTEILSYDEYREDAKKIFENFKKPTSIDTNNSKIGSFKIGNKEICVQLIPAALTKIDDHCKNVSALKDRLQVAIEKGFVTTFGKTGIKELSTNDPWKLCEVKILGRYSNGKCTIGDTRLLCLWNQQEQTMHGFELCNHREMRKVVESFNADPKKFSGGVLKQIETTFQDFIQMKGNKQVQQK